MGKTSLIHYSLLPITHIWGRTGFDGDVEAWEAGSGERHFKSSIFKYKR